MMIRPPATPLPLTGTTINRRSWLASAGALTAAACARSVSPGTISASAVPAAAEDAEILRLLRIATVPGLSRAVVRADSVSSHGFGVRRAGSTDAVTADTVFEAASLSKPVFAFLVLGLVGEGVLDLDRPLGEYLPLPNPADERARAITARHALSHSSGWRNWRFGKDQLLTADFVPGSRFSYSGEGYYFLQRVVEHATGVGLAALIRRRVLEPIGMRSSGYLWRPEMDAVLAPPHGGRGQPMDSFNVRAGRAFRTFATESGRDVEKLSGEEMLPLLTRMDPSLPPFPDFVVPNAAASLMTTARDYGAFVHHLLGAGRASLQKMMAPQIAVAESLHWGLGVGLEEVDGRTMFWHWGDNPGFKNFVVGDPERGTAVVVFTNGNSGRNVYERVVRATTGRDQPAFIWI